MAEREGFEPPIPFQVCRFSRPVPSTTRPPLRLLQFYYRRNFNGERGCPAVRWPGEDAWRSTEAIDHFVPFGYTSILLASPVFRRAMALEKSFIGMRSVITGWRSRRPLLRRAVIWYQVWYIRRPLMP